MSPELHNTAQESDTIQESGPVQPASTASTDTQAVCPGGTCPTGICSPCLFIWGGLAVWVIVNALWERFQ